MHIKTEGNPIIYFDNNDIYDLDESNKKKLESISDKD